jgi:hypothetical protein
VLAGGAFNAPLIPGTALLSRSAESAGIVGALAFGAANFAWASGYAIGASLGGTLTDLGGDAPSYLSGRRVPPGPAPVEASRVYLLDLLPKGVAASPTGSQRRLG